MSNCPTRLCALTLETGWLAAVLVVPVYFNIDDVHVFEPDKAFLLRDAVALLAVLALLRLLLRLLSVPPAARPVAAVADLRSLAAPARRPAPRDGHPSARPRLGRAVTQRPTLLPMLALAAVTLLATATSVLPGVSWGGSYARGQGALTMLAYLTMGLLVLGLVRTLVQVRRLVAAMALSGLAPAAYGWVQHFGHDPLPWQQADLTARVPGTLGNPIFLGALLVMTIPLALYNLALALHQDTTVATVPLSASDAPPSAYSSMLILRAWWGRAPSWRYLGALGWAVVVIVEAGGLLFTNSRGPFFGFVVGLTVLGLGLARAWDLRRLGRLSLALAGAAVVAIVGANVLGTAQLGHVGERSPLRLVAWVPHDSGSSEVRLLIWRPALDLVARRPLLGCGPDTLLSCYYPVYPTALRHVEASNAVPDRTHDIFLDAATETGLLGLAAFLAFLGVPAAVLIRLVARARRPTERATAAGLLAALLGHVAEGIFGIAVVDTLLLAWLIAGLVGALSAMEAPVAGVAPAAARLSGVAVRRDDRPAGRGGERRAHPVEAGATKHHPLVAAAAGVLAPREDTPLVHANGKAAKRAGRGEKAILGSGRPPGPIQARGARALALGGLIAACWVAWQVVAMDATATAADVSARQGVDLEAVALGNSGQAPLPHGRKVQPILGLRQFAAASVAQDAAMRLVPDQEEYPLDAGRALVEWGQAAASVGGPAAAQAGSLYARSLLLFGQAARLNPYDPDPLRDTGKAYERWAGLGHDAAAPATWNRDLLARAAQAFARAADLAPHHPDPLISWAQVLLWQGRPQQAFDLANRALALDSRDGDGYRVRADAEIALGQRADALADWRHALDDPAVGQRGPTAGQLALAEATWARARCTAVVYGQMALGAGGLTSHDATVMAEIVHVDGPQCRKPRHG